MNLDITKQILAAVVRWLLFSVGAWLVKKGIIDQTMADAWVTEVAGVAAGLALIAIPLIWKYFNAKYHFLTLIAAVQVDPPADNAAEIKSAVADVKASVQANNTVAPL